MRDVRKNMMLLFAGCFLLGIIPLAAQDDGGPQILQTREQSGYLLGHTRGVGFGYQRGRILSIHSTLFWQAELVTMKHPK